MADVIGATNKKTRKAPCPQGTRYNNKTKRCEPIIKKSEVAPQCPNH